METKFADIYELIATQKKIIQVQDTMIENKDEIITNLNAIIANDEKIIEGLKNIIELLEVKVKVAEKKTGHWIDREQVNNILGHCIHNQEDYYLAIKMLNELPSVKPQDPMASKK